jgi:hypothetical protein
VGSEEKANEVIREVPVKRVTKIGVTFDASSEQQMTKYLQWFIAHERLILVLALVVFGGFLANKAYDYLLKHDQVQAQIAHDQAVQAATAANNSQKTSDSLVQALSQVQTQIQATNQRIDQQMQQRATATQTQKHVDDQSDPAATAARTAKLIGAGNVSIASPLGAGLVFDMAAAHANLDLLEDNLQAQADVKDLNQKLSGCQTLSAQQTTTITALNTTVADKNLALTSEQQSHAKDVKQLKDENRKSWLRGFKWGAITGFVGGLFVPKV